MWQNMASRSLGSNHVLFGGMMPPASAMAIRSSMLVGKSEKAQAYSPLLTSFSNSAVPRMPPTKLMRVLLQQRDVERINCVGRSGKGGADMQCVPLPAEVEAKFMLARGSRGAGAG